MRNRKKKEPVAFEVIEAAVAGDVVAINQIVDYFQPYINSRCRRKFIDESGQIKYGIDEYMKRRMETKLITKILVLRFSFNTCAWELSPFRPCKRL